MATKRPGLGRLNVGDRLLVIYDNIGSIPPDKNPTEVQVTKVGRRHVMLESCDSGRIEFLCNLDTQLQELGSDTFLEPNFRFVTYEQDAWERG